ncbi:conserved hypothetical protein [uncultured Gammaproteobacteria bacterium]
MADNLLTAPSSVSPAAAPRVPDKFRDPRTGEIRVDALLKSYLELERRLSAAGTAANVAPDSDQPGEPARDSGGFMFDPADPVHRAQVLKALGVPDGPDGYCIDCAHGLFTPDTEINQSLHSAGFTPEQAQMVYDLAAQRLVPMVKTLASEFEAEGQLRQLVDHFGGQDKWREVSRQILVWARRNLPAPAVEALSTTTEGVLALYRLMRGGEPSPLRSQGQATTTNEADLHKIMRDPRYWRDRNPEVVAKVTDGFRRLYPDRPA